MSEAPILWLVRVIMRGRSGASFLAGMIVSAALFFCLEGVFLSSHNPFTGGVPQVKPREFLGVPVDITPPPSPQSMLQEQPPVVQGKDIGRQPAPLSKRQMVSSAAEKASQAPLPITPQLPDFSDFDNRRRRKRVRRSRRRRRLTDEDYEDDDDAPQRYEDDDERRDAGGGNGFRNEAERLFWLHQQLYLERQRQAGLTQAGSETLASALNDAIQPQAPVLTSPISPAPVLESAAQPEVKADVLPASAAQAVETQQQDASPPRIRQPTLPEDCGAQGEWVQAAKTIVDAHNTFHRMDGVCFDYRRRRTYALNEQALASLSPSARRDAPFPFAGVLSEAVQNRTHMVRGATLFLKTQHEGMHGRWDHLLDWANTVLPLAATRFATDASAPPESRPSWAAAVRSLDSVLLYDVSEQDFYHPDARWMRELLEGLLAYVREGQGQGQGQGGGKGRQVARAPERVFLTVNGMRKRPLMCFDSVVVAAPPQKTLGSTERDAAASSDGAGTLGGERQRPWQFFPTVCAAHDLRRFLLSRLHTHDSAPSQASSPSSGAGGRGGRSALLLLRAGRRRWANEEAVVAQTRELLRAKGGWEVKVQHSDRGGVALADVALAVASSDLLISPPGSQLVHMAFLPSGASVIQVRPNCPAGTQGEAQGGATTPYVRLAHECGLRLIAAPVMGCGEGGAGRPAAAGAQAGDRDQHQIDFDSALRPALELMEL